MKQHALWLVLWIPSIGYGWGVDGHKIIAEIAAHHLDANAREAVKAILGEQTMVDVCTWADQIRKQPEYIFTDGCHGVKIPFGADGFDMERDCPDARCAPAAIDKYSAILQDTQAAPVERLEALKFVIHFVGDIHCPVHAPYKRGEGNVAGEVMFLGEKVSLHKVWDSTLIGHVKISWKRYATRLDRKITPEQREKWAKVTSPCDWATESYRAFVDHAAVSPESSTLGEEYFKRTIPVVDERLSMGGIRLAAHLNRVLGQATATQPAAAQPATMAAE